MSRHLARLLEVKIDGTVTTTPEAKEAKYIAAAAAYVAGSTLEEADQTADVLAARANEKIFIIDPTSSEAKKELDIVLSDGTTKKMTVIGLHGKEGNEPAVLQEIYWAIGNGYTVFFSENDGESPEGASEDLEKDGLKKLVVPENFKDHMARLQAFSDYVFSVKGGLDKVDVAGETQASSLSWFGGRHGSLYDPKDPKDQKNGIAAAFQQGKMARLGVSDSEALSQARGMLLTAIDVLKVKIIKKAAIPEGDKTGLSQLLSEQCDLLFRRQEIQSATTFDMLLALQIQSPQDDNQLNWTLIQLQYDAANRLKDEVDIFLKAATAVDDNWAFAQKKVAQVNALILLLNTSLAPMEAKAKAGAVAAVAMLEAEIATLTQTLQEKLALVATTKEAHEAAAKKAQQEESATHHLLTVGFYSKDKDLSHVFAEKGLDAYKSRAPVAGTRYAGAFTLPAPTDKTAASLNPLEAALNTAKQKIESTAADKIILPVTLRFLMHAPGTPGHETVLDVAIDAVKKITITHFDSLLPVGTSQSHSSFPAAVLTKIQGVFNAGYTLDPVRQAANPIGTQPAGSVECVYFAVAEIAKNYEPAAKLPLPATGTALDEASKATMKLAVTKLMADAEQSAYMLAHADKAITEPLRTVCVEPTELKSATEADAAKYNVVPGLEALKAGDVIYPVILENKRLAHEINQKAAATTGDVKALQADAAFIQLCGDLIKNNAPAEPALNSLNSAAQRVLVELMVMNAHRQAIVLAVPQAVGSITIADRANVQDVVKNAVTPFDLENNAVKALNKGEAGRELLKGFSAVVKTAQDDCQKRLAALTATKNDADKKADSTDTKKTTTTTEGGDAFKKLDVEARKKVMSSLSSEMKKTFTLPSQFKKVEFEVVKQKNKQTGQTENAISVEKTADKDECRVTLSVTVTKTDKAQAEKPVDVTLVRTVIGEKVERKCETTSDLVDWKTQCALMAAASIAERKEVAKLESTADKKVEPDLNIQVAIKNSGSAVPGQLIGGVKRDGFSHDEAIMINAYLEAGFKRVQCQGVDFYPAGQTKASSYVLSESKPGSSALASVAKGLPPVKSPDVATSAPDQKDRPPIEGSKTGAKKGLCINFKMQFSDPKAEAESKATERGLTETEQAHAILKNALALHKKGYAHVGITYSANQDETQKVLAHNSALHAGKTGADVPAMPSFGAHQGSVMNEVVRLLSADPAYQSIQSVFRIVPMTTMKYVENNKVALADQKSVDQSIQYLNAFIAGGGALLRWQNQHTRPDHCALGGGVAKEMPESDKAAHKVQLAQMQDALRKQMDPAPTKAATPAA